MNTTLLQCSFGILASIVLIVISLTDSSPIEMSSLEALAVVACAWSVWLLARNQPLGWWVGLIGVAAYAVVFYQVRLYAEVGIQVFYFFTSLQAIYLWLHGGLDRRERPVGRVSIRGLSLSGVLIVVGVVALHLLLIAIRGAAPFWDAVTTVLSVAAHLYLMGRYLESWYLWIVVDVIYIPLYASRELYATSALYAVFLVLAIFGLRNFWVIYKQQLQSLEQTA